MRRSLVVSPEQHRRFAAFAGDHNPLHVDPVQARRLMHGGVVVHGMHTLLRAIHAVVEEHDIRAPLARVSARFLSPVPPDTSTELTVRPDEGGGWGVKLRLDAATLAEFHIGFSENSGSTVVPTETAQHPKEEPHVLTAEDVESASGALPLVADPTLADELFPGLSSSVPIHQIAALAATSRIVGMLCPGLNSVYSELELDFRPQEDAAGRLEYRTTGFDPRFGLVTMAIEGAGSSGTVTAFLRPEAQPQPSVERLRSVVTPGEFEGERSLVVGGSRGLGELAAKVLGLGGAKVLLTYHRGREDAERVAEEIRSTGGDARTTRFDVTAPSGPGGSDFVDWQPTKLLYFASPRIFHPRHAGFSTRLFDMFTAVYLTAFVDLFEALAADSPLAYVLYPSTVAVTEQPRELFEYAAAKAAGESACAYLQRRYPSMDIRVPRLPRVPTDQTTSMLRVPASDPIPIILENLRARA